MRSAIIAMTAIVLAATATAGEETKAPVWLAGKPVDE